MKKYSGYLIFLLLVVLSVFIWRFPLAYPLKSIPILFHEIGYMIGGLISGGDIIGKPSGVNTSYENLISGGHSGVIILAGYLGSFLGAFLIFSLGLSRKYRRLLLTGFCVLIMITALVNLVDFSSLVIPLVWTAIFLAYVVYADFGAEYLMIFLGLFTGLYPLYDFLDYLQFSKSTDGSVLAEIWGLDPFIWLLLISGVVILLFAKILPSKLRL
jgi:hypothetical protein